MIDDFNVIREVIRIIASKLIDIKIDNQDRIIMDKIRIYWNTIALNNVSYDELINHYTTKRMFEKLIFQKM